VIVITRVVMARRLKDIDPKHNCRAEMPGIFDEFHKRTDGGDQVLQSGPQILCLIDWEADFCHINGKSRLWCPITIVNRDYHAFAV
jgi:hypothetical protein